MSQLGRIGGQVLTDNLLRAGVDLAFETDLLYLNVTNQQIGIRDSSPVYTLDVNNNIYTNDLTVVTQLAPGNLRFNAPNTISTSVGGIDVYINGGGEIFHDRLVTDNLILDGNLISSLSNSNIVLDPNGSGTVELRANTNITGNLAVSGNINIGGNLSSQGTLTFGDNQTFDTVTINTDFTQSIIPGDDVTYAMGADAGDSSVRRWSQAHAPDWTTITDGAWPGSGLRPQSVIVSEQLRLDGVINKISATQSNEDVWLNPATRITHIESVQFGQPVTLNNPNAFGTSAFDQFGYSVSISGNYAIVGAFTEDDAGTNGAGKAYIFNVTTGALVHTLNNPNAYGSADDLFGNPVAISGNYAIVGVSYEDDAGGTESGKAYIYNVTTGALLHTLNNPNAFGTSASDYFGYAVAISGNYAIVGAVSEDDGTIVKVNAAVPTNGTTGLSLLFSGDLDDSFETVTLPFNIKFLGVTYNQLFVGSNGYISFGTGTGNIPNANDGNSPGYPHLGFFKGDKRLLTLYGGVVTAGVYTLRWEGYNYGGSSSNKTIVEIRWFENSAAHQVRYTTNANGATYLEIGDGVNNTPVAITLVSTLQGYDITTIGGGGTGLDSGKAYIYNVTTGTLVHTLDNPNAYSSTAGDQFGSAVAISDNYAIVGAYDEDDAGGTRSSKAYIFNVTTGALVHTLNNPNAFGTSLNDLFGRSVAISGNYAIVGAWGEDDAGGTLSGKAYIFNVTTGALLHTLNNPNAYGTSAFDQFGESVAISGNYAIVGARVESDAGGGGSGKVYIFNVTTGALLRTVENINAYGTSAVDQFGFSVAISGNYAIVGAYAEDDVGGEFSGKAYIIDILGESVITNQLNTPLTFASTAGIGYLRFMGDNAFVIPAGTDLERRASPELGETRWNTDESYLECYDGTVWAVSTGGGIEVDVPIMEDLSHAYTLMLG